jgi:hypothetical protein
MADLFRTLIIAAEDADIARTIAASFGSGGTGMWTTPLSSDGQEPATHYISSGGITAEFVLLAPCTTWIQDEEGNWVQTDYYPGDPVAVYTAATAQGVVCTQEDVDTLFATADVTEQEPFVAMGRLGLTIINPPLDTTTVT